MKTLQSTSRAFLSTAPRSVLPVKKFLAPIALLTHLSAAAFADTDAASDSAARLQLGRYREVAFSPVSLPVGQGELLLQFPLPEGHKYAAGAPFEVELRVLNNPTVRVLKEPVELSAESFPITVPLEVSSDGALSMTAALFFCSETSGTCYVDRLRGEISIRVNGSSRAQGVVNAPLVIK